MITNYKRPTITAGNDFYINITMTEIQGEDILNFDLSKCKSVEVYLICATHNTKIDLDFEILDTPENNVIKAFVDHRMLHNTSYGICVEGDYEDDLHWRWYMLPKEGMLIIPNTSGQNIPTEVEYVDLAGRVGFGVDLSDYYNKEQTDILLEGKVDVTYLTENYYDKTETDALLDNKADAADLNDYYTKTETDNLLDNKADASDLANKQDVLVSGDNIKTINNQSLLGSGNIDIQSGGNYTAGNNIDITNNTISLEDDITVSSVTINKHIDYVLWWDGDNRYLAEEAMHGNQFQVGQNWYDIGDEYKLYIKTGQADYTINGSEWVHAERPYPSYLPLYSDIYKSTTIVNGEYVYGRYNPDTGNPDFYIYDDNVTIYDVYVEYEFLEQSDWNETNPHDPGYIHNKPDLSIYAQSSSLATVATSGDYNDLSNKPTINTPGFNQLVRYNRTGLVSSLSTDYNTNIGNGAVIEGDGSISKKIEASGALSHAEGFCTFAKGNYSHAEGIETIAQGYYSHAEGMSTKAYNTAEHASGGYNISIINSSTWGNSGNTLFSVGNGKNLYPHNAVEIKQNGDIYISDTNNTTYSNFYEKPMLKLQDVIANKQDVLISGTNIKTINNQSILGSGDITISGGVQSDWNETDSSSLAYILNKPTIPAAPVQSDWNESDNTTLSYILNKPDLSNYATQSDLANKQDTLVSGTNIKTINGTSVLGSGDIVVSGGGVQSDWNETDSSSLAYILNKPTIPAAPVQSDWNESDNTSLAYIQNKPTIPSQYYDMDVIYYFELPSNSNSYAFRLWIYNVVVYSNGQVVWGSYDEGFATQNTMSDIFNYIKNTYGINWELLLNNIQLISTWPNFVKSGREYYLDIPATLAGYTLKSGDTFVIRHRYNNWYNYKQTTIQIPYVNAVTSSVNGMKIEVVSALPASPDSNTVYLVV